MNDNKLLKGLQKGRQKSLEQVIERYTPFVSTIVYHIIGKSMSIMDVEEVTADTFLALWEHAETVAPGKLKAYLGAVARNKAKSRLREHHVTVSLEEDCLDISTDSFEDGVLREAEAACLKRAVDSLGIPQREIFVRYYYYYQTTGEIAAEMNMNRSTVQTSLCRGRQKLKQILLEEGYVHED